MQNQLSNCCGVVCYYFSKLEMSTGCSSLYCSETALCLQVNPTQYALKQLLNTAESITRCNIIWRCASFVCSAATRLLCNLTAVLSLLFVWITDFLIFSCEMFVFRPNFVFARASVVAFRTMIPSFSCLTCLFLWQAQARITQSTLLTGLSTHFLASHPRGSCFIFVVVSVCFSPSFDV